MKSMNRRNVKVMAAILGGSAAVTAGALSATLVPQQGANVYDILRRDTLVLTRAAIDALEERFK